MLSQRANKESAEISGRTLHYNFPGITLLVYSHLLKTHTHTHTHNYKICHKEIGEELSSEHPSQRYLPETVAQPQQAVSQGRVVEGHSRRELPC